MREIYRGNGFIITTNDCGEVFVSLETAPHASLRISAHQSGMGLTYVNTGLEMVPISFKTLGFKFA